MSQCRPSLPQGSSWTRRPATWDRRWWAARSCTGGPTTAGNAGGWRGSQAARRALALQPVLRLARGGLVPAVGLGAARQGVGAAAAAAFATKAVDESLAQSSARRGSDLAFSRRGSCIATRRGDPARIHLFEKLRTFLCWPFIGARKPSERRKRHFSRTFF